MRSYRVLFAEDADRQLLAIWRYIAETSDLDVADRVVADIRERCLALNAFPNRGTPRDDLRVGLRTVPMPRKATIGFTVTGEAVVIVAIAYRGQDLARLVGTAID